MVFSLSLLRAMNSSCTEKGGASCASCSAKCCRMHVSIVLGLGWFFCWLRQFGDGMLC